MFHKKSLLFQLGLGVTLAVFIAACATAAPTPTVAPADTPTLEPTVPAPSETAPSILPPTESATGTPAPMQITAQVPNTGITSTETTPASATAEVMVSTNATLGEILTDGRGMTLYVFAKDTPGVSNCNGGCAALWPPFTVMTGTMPTAGPGITAMLGTFVRTDGTLQMTVNGLPVYFWSKDMNPGDANGQGFGKVWYALDAAGKMVQTSGAAATAMPEATTTPATSTVMVSLNATLGLILTGGNGQTLYAFTKDTPGVSNCTGACASSWVPLTVAAGVTPTADMGVSVPLGTLPRSDGTLQVTVNQRPVYFWSQDMKPGDALGQGFNSAWYVLDAAGDLVQNGMGMPAPTPAPTSTSYGG